MKLPRTESGGKVLLIGRGRRVRAQGCLKGRKRLRERQREIVAFTFGVKWACRTEE